MSSCRAKSCINIVRSRGRRIIAALTTNTGHHPEPFLRRHGAAAAVLLVANLLLFWPVLFHGRVFSSHAVALALYPWRGVSGVTTPKDRLLADPATSSETQLRKFRDFPRGFFWSRANACGVPGPVNFVQGNLSPFFWIPALVLPEAGIETGILFLKLNAGFLFAYLFLRRRFSGAAAAAGAATWGFTSAQSCWWLWMQTSVSIFYPLVLLAVDIAFSARRRVVAIAISGAVFLGMFSGGFPFSIVFGGLAGIFYFAFRSPESGVRASLRALGILSAGAVLAAAILAPPALLSWRFLRETGHIARRRGLAERDPMPLRQARLYFLPDYNGDPAADDYTGVGLGTFDNYFETASGVGPFAFGLAALGLASRRRRRLVAFAAALAGFVAVPLYAGGPILRAVGSLPGISAGHFERAKILVVFAIAIAAAAGFEVAEEFLAAAPRLRRILAAVPFAIAVPLVLLAARIYPALRPPDAVFRDTPGIRFLRERGEAGPYRFFATGWTLIPNVAEALGLEDLRGHLLHEASYRTLLSAADPRVFGSTGTLLVFHGDSLDPRAPVLDFLNAASIAAPPGVARPDSVAAMEADAGYPIARAAAGRPGSRAPALERVYAGPDLTVFDRPGAFPRFFAVSRARPGSATDAAAADRDTLRTTVFVSGADAAAIDAAARASRPESAEIRMTRDADERFEVDVAAPAETVVASSQKRFEPYWQTSIDGRPLAAFSADGPFYGFVVPAGRHRIEGRFRFPRAELALSGAAALLLAAAIAAAARPRAL